MDELKPLICQCCGGHIDRRTMSCPYCETRYNGKLERVPVTTPFVADGVETLSVSVRIPEEDFFSGEDVARRIVYKKLSEAIAKSMLPYLEVREHRSEASFDRFFTGLVKFVKP